MVLEKEEDLEEDQEDLDQEPLTSPNEIVLLDRISICINQFDEETTRDKIRWMMLYAPFFLPYLLTIKK